MGDTISDTGKDSSSSFKPALATVGLFVSFHIGMTGSVE